MGCGVATGRNRACFHVPPSPEGGGSQGRCGIEFRDLNGFFRIHDLPGPLSLLFACVQPPGCPLFSASQVEIGQEGGGVRYAFLEKSSPGGMPPRGSCRTSPRRTATSASSSCPAAPPSPPSPIGFGFVRPGSITDG